MPRTLTFAGTAIGNVSPVAALAGAAPLTVMVVPETALAPMRFTAREMDRYGQFWLPVPVLNVRTMQSAGRAAQLNVDDFCSLSWRRPSRREAVAKHPNVSE